MDTSDDDKRRLQTVGFTFTTSVTSKRFMAGVAWELGILMGFYDTGVDVRGAGVIIGTSAGLVVGAQIASGTDLESLFNSQLTRSSKRRNARWRSIPFR